MKGRKVVNAQRRASSTSGWLYGLHAIESWLEVDASRVERLYLTTRPSAKAMRLLQLAQDRGVSVERAHDSQLTALSGAPRHQGVVASVREFPYASIEAILKRRPPVVLILDRIQDPRNLGAILRTACAVGAGGVFVPKDGCAPMSSTVETAAAGAAARIPIGRVANLVRLVEQLKALDYWVVGLDTQGETRLYDFTPPKLSAVVVGGEAGLRPLVLRNCDYVVSIPMPGRVESLNVSVAVAVLLYEIYRQLERAGSP